MFGRSWSSYSMASWTNVPTHHGTQSDDPSLRYTANPNRSSSASLMAAWMFSIVAVVRTISTTHDDGITEPPR